MSEITEGEGTNHFILNTNRKNTSLMLCSRRDQDHGPEDGGAICRSSEEMMAAMTEVNELQ